MSKIKLDQEMSYGLRQMLSGDGIDRKIGCEILQNVDLKDHESFNIIKDMILDTDLLLTVDVINGNLKFEIPVWKIIE